VDYWTFMAKSSLRPLHDLVNLATRNSVKEPLLTYDQAMAAEGLFKITGPAALLDNFASTDDLFIGLSPATPYGLFKAAFERGFNFFAKSDNVYPRAEDLELYRMALGWRAETATYPRHILTDGEWHESLALVESGIRTRAITFRGLVLSNCLAELKVAELLKPETEKTLLEMCLAGAEQLGCNLNNPVYAERLERELGLIKEKKFEDYFFILADLISYAKKHMIVGPARGSSCGSLVCYLIGITTIDPIPYGLIFERFIDINRSDLPDIDVDFADDRRDMVFAYAEQKYGADRVARLGTVSLFKPRSALKQAGGALRIPTFMVERALEGVIERSGGDSRAMMALEDTLNSTEMGRKLVKEFPHAMMAAKLEGHPDNASQHAAGIVLTQQPIAEYVAVDARTNAAMADKKDAEELNLLKIDALGLTQLSIFQRCLELMGKPSNSAAGFLEGLPLDDQKAFEVLNSGKFSGIFQFTGTAMRSLCKQIKIESLEDVISVTALARPGPMAAGGTGSWAKRRQGEEAVSSAHPLLAEITKETLGIVMFQEQTMRIVRDLGNFTWEETSAIRKAMSGRLGDEFFARYWEKFLAGARKNGLEDDLIKEVWDQTCTFGSWAMNRSHCVAYGTVSYWCCWLKAHYPMEFAAATLDAEKDPVKQLTLLRELAAEGIDYMAVDPEHSTERWSFKREGNSVKLIGPLTMINGIGPAAMKEIIECRKRGVPLRAVLAKKLEAAHTKIDQLWPIRAAAETMLKSGNVVSLVTPISQVQPGRQNEVCVVGVFSKIAPKDENEAVNVMKRGGQVLTGPTDALNLFLRDDEDEIFCKVNRFKFNALGRPIIERGGVGKALYAIKGTVPRGFRMISINAVRYLGDI
jgi:DNA-directed DNA polymerase III PolC